MTATRVTNLISADAPSGLDPIRVGVVGYGYWGSKHVRVLATMPGVEVTVIEERADRLREAVAHFPAVRVASRLDEVCSRLEPSSWLLRRTATVPLPCRR